MFDLAEMLKSVSNLNTREQIEYLPFDLLDPDPDNFYSIDGLNELADSIATVGLVHPLRVRQNGERFTITSGHRRRAAIQLLIDSGEDWSAGAPCIVDRGESQPEFDELKLIFANQQRQKTSAELSREAQRVEELLCALKEKGFEFPGRMQDHVAQAMGVKASKLKRLHAIRGNAEKSVLAAYDAGEINESVAYEFSKIPVFAQQQFMRAKERACLRLDVLTAEEVRDFYDLYCKLRDLRCKAAGCNCPWSGDRLLEALRQMNGYHGGTEDDGKPFGYGNCTKGKCCLGCRELLACPAVRCRYTEPEVKEREAAEAERMETAAEENGWPPGAHGRAPTEAETRAILESPLQEPGEIEPRWIPGAPEALGRYMCLMRGNADGPEEPDKEFRVDIREDGPYLFNRPMLRGYIITAHWPLPPLGDRAKEA